MKGAGIPWLFILLTGLQTWAGSNPLNAQDSPPADAPRIWTAADGRNLAARLVSNLGWKVVVEREGTPMTIPLTSLSLVDREWLDAEWLINKSRYIGADPMSCIDVDGNSSKAIQLAEQIRELGFADPVWRALTSSSGPGPALRVQVRKADFSPSNRYTKPRPSSAAVYYVLLNSKQAGGTVAYAEVVWDEESDLFSSSPSLAQLLVEQLEAKKYTALALAGDNESLKHYALQILDPATNTASIQDQRACLLALGDGRSVESMDLARLCVVKLVVPELCLEAARALGLSRGLDSKPILARLEVLREQLKRNSFHSKCAESRQDISHYWTRLGVADYTDLHQVVDFAITRLNPSKMIGRLDQDLEYEERNHLLAVLRPYLLDEIERTGAGSEDVERWMGNLIRQCDPLAMRLILDSLSECEDEKEFRRLVKYIGGFKRPSEYWHRGSTALRGCDANPFRKSWGRKEVFSSGRFQVRGGSPYKLVPLPQHERAVELLIKSMAEFSGALSIFKTLEESALNALPELNRYLQKIQEQKSSPYHREAVLEVISEIANASRARAMNLPQLPGLAEAVARELTDRAEDNDISIAMEAINVLKPLGKQAASVLPQMETFARTPAGQEIASELTDAMTSIQLEAAAN